jgi:hypothetical protein
MVRKAGKKKCDGEMSNIVAREYDDTSLASPEDSDVIYTIQCVRRLCAMPMPSVLLLESNSAATSCHPDPIHRYRLPRLAFLDSVHNRDRPHKQRR